MCSPLSVSLVLIETFATWSVGVVRSARDLNIENHPLNYLIHMQDSR